MADETPAVTPVAVKEVSVKEVVEQVVQSKEYRDAIDSLKVETKVAKNMGEDFNISIKEMNDALKANDVYSFKELALNYIEENDLFTKAMRESVLPNGKMKSNLNIKAVGKGLKILNDLSVKSTLVPGTNTSGYTQANVEFADLFAPGLVDTFNNQVNLFGFLKKEQHMGGSHYQWKMVTNEDPLTLSSFAAQNDVTVTKGYANLSNYQTPIKIARRGVSVADFMLRNSAASLGNLFQVELDLQMNQMMRDVNTALFAAVADGTGNSPLGLEAVANAGVYTTLYGLTRSAANRLGAAGDVADYYINVGGNLTEAALRTGIRNLEIQGSARADIVIVCSPAARDYLYNLLDGQRTFINTEAAFGFVRSNVPTYDGFPIIIDPFCTADSLFIIDTNVNCYSIVMAMAPTIVNLAKVGAATEAFVEMDFAAVYKQPRRIHMLNGLSGP